MSRLLNPCWRFALHYDKMLLRNYHTSTTSRILFWWQSSNHFRIAACPVSKRWASGARYFPLHHGDQASTQTLANVCVPDDVTSASSEDHIIGSTNQPTNCSSSSGHNAAPKVTPYINGNENARLMSNYDETIDRESFAVQEDEALFLDDFNRNLPSIKPIKHPESYWASLHQLEKDLFNPTPQLHARSAEDNINYIKRHNITVVGEHNVPPLIHSFKDYNFPDAFAKLLQEHFEAPTPVQAIGWSAALKGYDVIGVGQAGTGKTLGYLIPALLHISHHMKALKKQWKDQPHSPLGIVIAPTRELVDQITKVAEQYGPSIGVHTASVIGGSSRDCQVDYMRRRNIKLAVSTPSRMLELIQNGSLSLDQCSFVVLDEADKMLDPSLEPQIRCVLAHTRPGRQTMLWSATWPESARQLVSDLLSNPFTFTVGSTTMLPSSTVTQHVHVTELHDRRDLLRQLLREHFEQVPNGKALVFAATVDEVIRLKKSLRRCSSKFTVESFQGNMLQRSRTMILDGFRRGYFSVLVASDLASRGLDIPGLSCVVNFDFPKDIESYIHRVGRAGRNGNPGVAHTFFCQRDTPKAKKLVEVLNLSGQRVDSKLRYMALKQDLPASMTETYIPFVPLRDRFGNPLVQNESSLTSGMRERQGPIWGSAKDQAFILRQEAKRDFKVAYLKTKPHATRHCVEPVLRPRSSELKRRKR